MAKEFTIKQSNGVTLYPKTVTELVYDNDSGKNLKEVLDEERDRVDSKYSEIESYKEEVNSAISDIYITLSDKQDTVELNNLLKKYYDILEDDSVTWTHGTIIGDNANIYTGNYAGSLSDYIEVDGGFDTLLFRGSGHKGNICVIGYDKNKVRVKNLSGPFTSTFSVKEIPIPSIVSFIRICYWDSCKDRVAKIVGFKGVYDEELNKLYGKFRNEFITDNLGWTTSNVASNSYGGTGYVDVRNGKAIYTNAYSIGNSIGMALFDENKQHLGNYNIGTTSVLRKVDLPLTYGDKEVAYIMCACYNKVGKLCFIDRGENNTIGNNYYLLSHKVDKEAWFDCSFSLNKYSSDANTVITKTIGNTYNILVDAEANGSNYKNLVKVTTNINNKDYLKLVKADDYVLFVIEAELVAANGDTASTGVYSNSYFTKTLKVGEKVTQLYGSYLDGTYLTGGNGFLTFTAGSEWNLKIQTIVLKKEIVQSLFTNKVPFSLCPFHLIDWVEVYNQKRFSVSNFSDNSLVASKLKIRINDFFPNGKYVAFGDSITQGTNGGYVPLIANYFDMPYLNLGVSGSSPHGTNGNLSDAQLAKIPSDVAIVTISGGQNSWKTATDINSTDRTNSIGAFNYAIDYIRGINPKVIILLAPTKTSQTMFNDYRRIAENKGVGLIPTDDDKVINWTFDVNHKVLRYDNIHFTSFGNYRFASCCINEIRKYVY